LGAVSGWFHVKCLKQLRGVSKEYLDSHDFIYICRKCQENEQDERNDNDIDNNASCIEIEIISNK